VQIAPWGVFSFEDNGNMALNTKVLLATTMLGGLSLFAPTMSLAQSAPAASNDTAVEEIVVTGSRIRRDPTNSPTPLIQVGREQLLDSGQTNVIDFLADIPALSFSITPEDTTGSNLNDGGLSLLNLRGLGSVRTLTLVDGRRHVGSQPGTLAVDVDTIPRLLIKDIEVITGGASAVYGADAVSGVVNFIMRDDFQGLELDGSLAEINQDGQQSKRLSGLIGHNFLGDRLNVYASAEYDQSDEIKDADVDWRRDSWAQISNDVDPATAREDGVTDILFIKNARTYIRGTNFGGITILSSGVQPSPASDPDVPFQSCVTTSFSANCFSVAPTNAPNNSYIYNGSGVASAPTFGPIRANGGFSRVTSNGGAGQNVNTEQGGVSRSPESKAYRYQTGFNFDVTNNVRAFGEYKYVKEETYDAGQRVFHDMNIRAFAPGTVGAITASTAFEIGLDNAYLPTDVRTAITNNVRQVYSSTGVLTGTVADARAQHKLYGPARSQFNERNLERFVLGAKGDFGDLSFVKNVNWELSYTYGEMKNSNKEKGVDVVRYQASADAVVDTAGVVNGKAGEVVCRVQLLKAQGRVVPDAVIGGVTYSRQGDVISKCAPTRVFGDNGFTKASLDYMTAEIQVTDHNQQQDMVAFGSGELWDFWGAGRIGFALGGEWRKEMTSGTGRDRDTNGRFLFLNTGPDFLKASYDVTEGFVEGRLPLLKDSILGYSAELSGAYRKSDYSNVGEQSTHSLQFSYRPIRSLLIRATKGTAIRVPNLTETNDPYGQTFANGFIDPCSATVLNGLADQTVKANRIKNCGTLATAAGLNLNFSNVSAPNAYLPNYGSGSVTGLAGGNPFLKPETSESWTLGASWSPTFWPGLTLFGDYYDIKIKSAISSVTAQQAANQCVSGDNVNTGACATQTRDAASFQVSSFIQGSLNYAALTATGIDFGANYSFHLPESFGKDPGRFIYSLTGNWLQTQHDFVNIVDPLDSTDYESTVGAPVLRMKHTMTWRPTDALAFTWTVDWQSSQEIEDKDVLVGNNDRYDSTKYLTTGDFTEHGFAARWDVRKNVTLRAGVVNMFDAEPATWLGGTSADNFDLWGRRFYVGFNFRPW
jgi:outer membrane receptor protein involved in Fe transport